MKPLAALGLLLLVIPTYPSLARAECPTPEVSAKAILDWAIGEQKKVLSIIEQPSLTPNGQTLPDGTYVTRAGFRMDPSCAKKMGSKPEALEKTILQLRETVKKCAQNRLPAWTEALFNGVMGDHLAIRCDPKGCGGGENTLACAGKGEITFLSAAALEDPSIWFHELLHAAGLDNQSVCTHNSVGANYEAKTRDEVYFWQTACFSPQNLIDSQRGGVTDICRKPLTSYAERPNRIRYRSTDLARTCGFFDGYVKDEKAHFDIVRAKIWPAVFTCDPGPDCASPSGLNEKLRAANLDKLLLPEGPGDAVAWIKNTCAMSGGEITETPWSVMRYCLTRVYDSRLKDINEAAAAGKLTPSERNAYEGALKRLSARLPVLSDGIGSPSDLLNYGQSGRGTELLARSLRACRAEGLAGTPFCNELTVSGATAAAHLMSRWDRSVDNGIRAEDL